jgi:hypothetical protein
MVMAFDKRILCCIGSFFGSVIVSFLPAIPGVLKPQPTRDAVNLPLQKAKSSMVSSLRTNCLSARCAPAILEVSPVPIARFSPIMGPVSEREMPDLDAVAELPSFVAALPTPHAGLSPDSSAALRTLLDQKVAYCLDVFSKLSWEDLQNSDVLNRSQLLCMPTEEDLSSLSTNEKKIAVRELRFFVHKLYVATVKDYWREDFQSDNTHRTAIVPYLFDKISNQIHAFTALEPWPCLLVHAAFNFLNCCRNLGPDADKARHMAFRESVQIAFLDSITSGHVSFQACRDLLRHESCDARVAAVVDALYRSSRPAFNGDRFLNASALVFLERLLKLPEKSLQLFPDFDF